MSTQNTTKQYNLLGVKSNGLLFTRPKFISKEHKALYRWNRKLWGYARTVAWKLFITFTITDEQESYVPLINTLSYVSWELEHNFFFDKENVVWGIQH